MERKAEDHRPTSFKRSTSIDTVNVTLNEIDQEDLQVVQKIGVVCKALFFYKSHFKKPHLKTQLFFAVPVSVESVSR